MPPSLASPVSGEGQWTSDVWRVLTAYFSLIIVTTVLSGPFTHTYVARYDRFLSVLHSLGHVGFLSFSPTGYHCNWRLNHHKEPHVSLMKEPIVWGGCTRTGWPPCDCNHRSGGDHTHPPRVLTPYVPFPSSHPLCRYAPSCLNEGGTTPMMDTRGVRRVEWEGQRAVGWGGSLHSPYNRPTSVSIVIYPSHSCSFLPHTPHARRVSLGSFLPSVTPPGAYGQEGTCEWWILLWFSSYIF